MKIIARTIRGEHEYKANTEILTDRVYNLLELGLNDAIAGWNDNKRAEYQKYIKSQKRISRRTRKSSQKPESAAMAEASHQSDTAATSETTAVTNSDPNQSAA
jgi:hypothetical protein